MVVQQNRRNLEIAGKTTCLPGWIYDNSSLVMICQIEKKLFFNLYRTIGEAGMTYTLEHIVICSYHDILFLDHSIYKIKEKLTLLRGGPVNAGAADIAGTAHEKLDTNLCFF